MKIHQNSKKFNYNIQTINTDFNDFINLCSFQNDENKNIENIPNNIVSSIPNFFNQENINDNSNSDKTFRKFYPNNKNKYIILENGQKQLNKNCLVCTCKNSSGLKFYCE